MEEEGKGLNRGIIPNWMCQLAGRTGKLQEKDLDRRGQKIARAGCKKDVVICLVGDIRVSYEERS